MKKLTRQYGTTAIRGIVFSIFSLMFACALLAQTPKTESKEIYFRIWETYRVKDTMVLFLENAQGLGIKPGTWIKGFRQASPTSTQQHDLLQAGAGRVVKDDSLVMAFIKLYNPTDTLSEGDMVSLEMQVPMLSGRGIFSSLGFNDILFNDRNGSPIYRQADLIRNDDPGKEDSIYSAILDDLHETYSTLKNQPNLADSFKIAAKTGRYKGSSVLDIYRDATKKDVAAFLLYVKDQGNDYMGRDLSFTENFAAWLMQNCPYSYTSIKEGLFPVYRNKAEFEKKLPLYRTDILNSHAVLNLSSQAETLDFPAAMSLVDFAEALSSAVGDTVGNARAHFSASKIFLQHKDYDKAILECDKTTTLSLKAKDKDLELQAIARKIFCLNKSKKFQEGLALLAGFEKKLLQYRSMIGEDLYKRNLQLRFQYAGAIHNAQGDYDQALKEFAQAIEINKGIDSYEAINRNAAYYKFIGQANNDQGRPTEALESFKKSAVIYRHNFDTLNWAILQNEIANSYINLHDYQKGLAYCDSAYRKLLTLQDFENAGYSKSLMGDCYWELGKYDSAVMVHYQAIDLRKKDNDLYGQADSWQEIGQLYLLSGGKTKALNAYDSAAAIYQFLRDSAGLAETYNKKGQVYLNDENYKIAVDFFEKARGFNSKTTIESLYDLGLAWQQIDTARARYYYTACRRKSDSTSNTGYEFDATRALASLAYGQKNFKQGNQLYENCLALSRELNTPISYAYCLLLKAEKHYNATEMDSALSYYAQALQVLDTVSREEVVWQLNNIAALDIEMGKFNEAEQALVRAITLAEHSSNTLGLGHSLESTSFLYGFTGEFEKGLSNNDSAMSIFSRSGNMLRLANTYVSRGALLKSMGDFNLSIRSFLAADSIYKTELTNEYRHRALNDIGVVYYNQADYANAMRYFEAALRELKKGVIDEPYLLYKSNIAECQYYLKDYKHAEAAFLEVLPIAKEKKLTRIASGMALGLGKLYYELNQPGKAREQFVYAREYGLESGEKEKIVDALTYLGKINVQSGHLDSAENNFRRAVSVVARYKTGGGWEPYYELGLLFYKKKSFDSSIVYFRQSIDLLDRNAENLYGGEQAKKIFNNDPRKFDLYNKLIFAYYNTDNVKEAWAYANRSNIAGIKELSGSITTLTSDKDKNEALKKIIALQQSKKALETTAEKQTGNEKQETLRQIEIVEADYTNFLQDVVEKYPDLASYFSRFNADEFYNYKGKLPDDVAVALYLVNDKTLMIFTLTNEKLAVDTMTADLGSMVRAFIASTKQPQKNTATGALHLRSEPTDEDDSTVNLPFKDVADQLYKALVVPVYEKIKTKKRLCIIPTGIFSNMPFQCLGRKMTDSSFRFLVEDFGIFYTNKMKIFDKADGDRAAKGNLGSFAAFGVPDPGLHYNTREVEQIGKLVHDDSTIYTDSRATEGMAKFSLTHKQYIHFATHGVLNYSQEFSKSYLKFLPDRDSSGGNNGQLTIREIQTLPIRDCNLVTLSACETAITKELTRGWTISPANSFLERNVRSVIASLWKVDDEATSILMNEFYSNLDKKMDKVDALRLAQETLSRNPKYAHPFYWGAFVLYGDWR